MELVISKLTYSTYDSYSHSSKEWLGKIPSNWDEISNKYIFKLKKIQVGKKSSNYTLLSLTLKGIIKRDMENPQGKFPAEFDTYQEVKKGDFVFCLFDVEETPRTVGLSDYDGMITGAYTVLEANNDFDKGFLYYYYLNLDSNKRLFPIYRGLRNTIPKDSFFTLKTFVPSKPEQTAIANFLDDKTTKIDIAVAQKERLIELLKERKQIIIQTAVTKGLDSNVTLKDSGVEWIGEIPESWEVKRMKFLCSITTGGRNTEDKKESGKYPFFVRSQKPEQIDSYSFDGEAILTAGDGAGVGKVYHYINGKFDFHQRVYKFSDFKEISGKQLFFYIQANFFNVALLGTAKSTVDSLRLPLIQNFEIAFPLNKNEQYSIINEIETLETKYEKLIHIQQSQIDSFKEFKSSLIDSAVTGKIKVS